MGKGAKGELEAAALDQIVRERQEKAHQFAVDLDVVCRDPDKLRPYCDGFIERLKAEAAAGKGREWSDAKLVAGLVLQGKTNEEVFDLVSGLNDLRFGHPPKGREYDTSGSMAVAVAQARGMDLS